MGGWPLRIVSFALASGCSFEVSGLPESGARELGAFDLATDADLTVAPDLSVPPDLALPILSSCAAIKQLRPASTDGLYTIDPGSGATQVYCDMTTQGGGYTLVLRTVYDPVETAPLLTGYTEFYGRTIGQPSGRHGFRLAASNWPALNATGKHLFVHIPRNTLGADCGPLVYAGSGAVWSVPTPGSGNASIGTVATTSNVPAFNLNMQVSTTDNGPSQNCVNGYSATPWPYAQCCFLCPTYAAFGTQPAHPTAYYVGSMMDLAGKTAASSCGAAGPSFNSIGFYLLNAFEYYVK